MGECITEWAAAAAVAGVPVTGVRREDIIRAGELELQRRATWFVSDSAAHLRLTGGEVPAAAAAATGGEVPRDGAARRAAEERAAAAAASEAATRLQLREAERMLSNAAVTAATASERAAGAEAALAHERETHRRKRGPEAYKMRMRETFECP